MKKKLLIVIDSLGIGGAEKSLLTFLSVLDFNRFDVDLQLFGYGGQFEQFLPKEVRLLPSLPFAVFLGKPVHEKLLSFQLKKIFDQFLFSVKIRRKNLNDRDHARLYWTCFSKYFEPTSDYDVAVAYAQNLPTLYVVDKVMADMKFAWINTIYTPQGKNWGFYEKVYSKVDYITTVSQTAKSAFLEAYSNFRQKTIVIRDMVDGSVIERMSLSQSPVVLDSTIPSLLTVARLEKGAKGYDISLETCRILKERGIKFRWYAVGDGSYRAEMEQYIKVHHLEDTFILLGALANPYPVVRQCTLYVQTSRYEGFGLSIAEARILNKPVVTTEFEAVYAQMVPGKNGLVVPQDPVAVADAVERLLSDKELYESIATYLRQEKKRNTEEIEKFYKLLPCS